MMSSFKFSFYGRGIFGRFLALAATLIAVILLSSPAYAIITVSAPPIAAPFADITVGGGAIVPLLSLQLVQSDGGTDTLSTFRYSLNASSTITGNPVASVSLWKESGAHPGFQADQDTQVGPSTINPAMNGSVLQLSFPTPVLVGATPTDFFLVASTTGVAGITNGNGFDVRLPLNFASTTASLGLGQVFNGSKKFTLEKSGNLKISEVKLGSTGNALDEFVELYNAGENDINLKDLPLGLHVFDGAATGTSTPVALNYIKQIIPKHGYFLITNQTGYSGAVPPDATFATSSVADVIQGNAGLSIATTSFLATSSKIDLICWGTQPIANCEGANPQLPNLLNDQSFERKAGSASTAASMGPGGADQTRGNSQDTNDNDVDFVTQTANINPQNSFSPFEFPFGGGGTDLEKPRVNSSYPSANQTGVAVDIPFLGFEFNKVMASGTIISATATTTITLVPSSGGSNLCASVSYNPFPTNFKPQGQCNLSGALSPSTTYTFTIGTSTADLAGNALDQDPFTAGNQNYQISFTTGAVGQAITNTTPPAVVGTTPFPGSVNVPSNISKILVKFNQSTMNAATMNASTITLSGGITLSNLSFDSSTTSILSFTPTALAANTAYTLTVTTGVRNSNNIALPANYTTTFTTGASADYSSPQVIGVFPQVNNTLALNQVTFAFTTDDYLDPTTATTGAVTLSSGSITLPGTVDYDPVSKEGHFTAANALPANVSNLTLTLVAGALKNITGSSTAAKTFVWSTEVSNSDTTAPSPNFANADSFGIAVTFNEAVKKADAETLANYSVTVGGNPITLSALAGHTISYDALKRTAKISGLFLQPGSAFTVTVSGISDVSSNKMLSSVQVGGTVASPTASGGFLGPGETTGSFGPSITNFSSAGIGFMPGMRVMPMNAFISASTTYGFELPLSKQIPQDGTIVISFPSTSDYSVCCAATSTATNPFINEQNKDINGPGSGTIGVKTIAKDDLAKTVTLTLDTATNSEGHDFLRLALNDLRNPSIPKGTDSSGYTLDIKTKNSSGTLLESFTSNPIFIGGAVGGSATTTVTGTVSGNGGNLQDVTIKLMSPQTGMITSVTNASGVYTFSNLPANNQISSFGGSGTEYFLFTDPLLTGLKVGGVATGTAFFGEPAPTPIHATSSSIITRNFSLTPTTTAISFDIKLTGDNSTNGIFKLGETIDVFAGGPGKFITRTYTTTNTNYSGTYAITIPIAPVNGNWGVGIGPSMPKGMGAMNFGPPPAPSWAVPKPVNVLVSGCPSACAAIIDGATAASYTFSVSAADKTISGILKDSSSNVVSSAEVFAFSPGAGIGNHTQTSPAGVFQIKVAAGSYNVGAFIPGMGRSRESAVVMATTGSFFVDGSSSASTGSSGANPFVITITKSNFTITGRVTDGSNPVANAPVFSYRTDGPGQVSTLTDSSGNYTLYVNNGTWKVNSFIPGFGPMGEQTVIISGSSRSDINFSPSTSVTYRNLSGIVFESANANIATSTQGISGVIVRVSGANGTNETITGSDGTFSLRVPSGSYRFIDIFKPGYGRIAAVDHTLTAITTMDLSSADLYKPIRINTRQTVTVTIKDSSGNPLTVSKAFIDFFDTTQNFGNHAEITNGTSTSIFLANGASTTIRAFVVGVPSANVSVASDDTSSSYPNNTLVLSGVLEVNSNEKVRITVNTSTAALSTVSGKVFVGSATAGNELADAWVQFVDPTNNVQFGTQATSSGIYLFKIANGTYQVQAFKSGYVSTPTSLTVSGSTSSANIVITQAASTITGTITAGGSAASAAYVWAKKLGGGFASTKTGTDGTYTLIVDSGQWKISAAAEGYQKISSPNPVSAGATGVNLTLVTASTVSSTVSTSNTFTDTSSASFSDSTLGVKVGLDSGALGSSGNSSYLSAKQTPNIPQTLDTTVVGDKAFDISAVNGSSAVTNLQTGKTAEVTLTYTKSELVSAGYDTTTKVGNLKIAAWGGDDKKEWESLTTVATYKDSGGNAVASPASNLSNVSSVDFTTQEASHFSPYALSSSSNVLAPSTPAGFGASVSSNSAVLSWTANTENNLSGYFIYRDTSSSGSFPLLTQVGAVTTYTDSGRTEGITYYYKISAFDTANNESAATAAQSIKVALSSTGSGGGGGGGGGGGYVSSGPTYQSTTKPTVTPVAPSAAQPSVVALTVSPVFNKDISIGSRGDDVKRLQELLKQDKNIYPEGLVTGYFGPATGKAVKKFQEKYGLQSLGKVGPQTRAKLQEIFGKAPVAPKPAAEVKVPQAAPAASTPQQIQTLKDQIKALQIKLLEAQLKLLQEQLNQTQKK